MRRKLLIFCLLLSLLPLPAQAVFSDTWEALQSDPSGLTVRADSLEVTELNAADGTLALLNGFLSPWTLEISGLSEGGLIRLSDRDSGEAVLIRAEETQEPLPVLSAAQALRDLWETVLPGLFTALSGEEPPEIEEKSTSFRVLGVSPSRQSLTVSEALFSLLPEDTLSPLKTCLKTMFRDFEAGPSVSAYLDRLTLEGEMTMRRNLNGEGKDMAYQFGGRIGSDGGDIRKLTFIIGKNGDIFYFSVKAPAVRGSNSFQAALTVPKWTETKSKSSRKITLSIRNTVDKETRKLDDTLQLTSQKGKEETVSADYERETNDGTIKQVRTLSLRLRSTEEGALEGTLSCRQTHASTEVVRWQANVSVRPGGLTAAEEPVSQAQASVLLARMLAGKTARLSEKDRRQLNHLLRTDSWMNGAPVPPLPELHETEE